MKDKFIEKSEIERVGLRMLFDKIYKGEEGRDYFKYVTPAEGMDCYDGGGAILKDGSKIKSQIFEVKVRDTHYSELLLEKDKLRSLINKAKEFDATAYYVNITPNGCYIFTIKTEFEYEWTRDMHWVSTTDKSKGKKLKHITYIPDSEAKVYPTITRNLVYNKRNEDIISKLPKEPVKCVCGLDVFFNTKK